ncbi:electron transport complex subunit RsxG [Pseudoalteromonas sp. SSM20]|uniref:electron transport complex subunit RsxG n=1 Tax=unclassified Pseudoalteromonas TaxID=194690 RepID=UPI00237D8D0C|nr:electron transport complex subunit RsxG [Pseudoalteromonas sp. G4]MDE3274102.1 electron transport complex subunit RsxG [Pseudoalteromonas sp. G4]
MLTKSISKNSLILGAFAIASTALVTLTYILTKPAIEQNKQQKLMTTLSQVIDGNEYTNTLYLDCTEIAEDYLNHSAPTKVYRAKKDGKPVAVVLQSTAPDGYSGNIEILSAIYIDGTIAGVRVIEHKETPGLGDKVEIRRSDWIKSFNGKRPTSIKDTTWAVKKDGGEFDAFTGATITPRAVISAVKRASLYTQNQHQDLFNSANICGVNND